MISRVAIDRVTERTAASDAKYRKRIAGRPLRSHAKRLTDAELVAKLGEASEMHEIAGLDSAAIRHTLEIGPDENVLRQRTAITFGGEGLPLSELPTLKNLVRVPSSKVTGANRKVGRNEPCPCGSGKKFKKCCAGS
jgi:preprotein translocase subunit SecA